MRLVSPATLATLDAAAAGDSYRTAVALSAGAVLPLRAASAAMSAAQPTGRALCKHAI